RDVRNDTAGSERKLGHDFLTAIVFDLPDGNRVERAGVNHRRMRRIELPERANQTGGPRGDFELQPFVSGLVQADLGRRAGEAAPTETVLRMHRSRIWE